MSYISEQYKITWNFIRSELCRFIAGTVVLFIASVILSDLYFTKHTDLMMALLQSFRETVAEIAPDGNISVFALFMNNLKACVMPILLGLLPFIFLPVLSTAFNGALIGAATVMYQGLNSSILVMYLVGLMPHGIFELPAMFLSMAMGIYLCWNICRNIVLTVSRGGFLNPVEPEGVRSISKLLRIILRTFVCFVVPLLIIAACVETYITPILISKFLVI